MNSVPKISETEWEIMKVIWNKQPVTAYAIIDELNKVDPWHPKTVKTLLNRLVKKGALAFEREGREYHYRALVAEEACVRAVSENFLDRVFGGSLEPMLAHFVQHKKLTAKEIAELKKILKAKE